MKILIDPGHGGSDPGAVKFIQESKYTLSYAIELGRVLSLLGFAINYSRTTDNTVSLAQRGSAANAWGADYFISIHFNAGGGHGVETFALSPGGKAEKLAGAVQSALIASTNQFDRHVKFANFQVLRDTAMPAILIEGGFVDSAEDGAKITSEDYKRKYVNGVSKALCAFTGTPWKDVYTMTTATATPQPVKGPIAPNDIYLSVRVLDNLAEKAIEDIHKLGFACQRLELA